MRLGARTTLVAAALAFLAAGSLKAQQKITSLRELADDPELAELFDDIEPLKLDDISTFFMTELPQVFETLSELRSGEPHQLHDALEQLGHTYFEYHELLEHAPERAARFLQQKKAELQSWRLGREIRHGRRATAEGREAPPEKLLRAKEAELRRLVAESFETRMQREKEEMKQIEKELTRLRARVLQRQALRDKIIERRVLELTGGLEALEW